MLRLLAGVLLLVALAAPAGAEPVRPGSSVPSEQSYPVSDYWLRQDALKFQGEWVDGDDALYLWQFPSVLTRDLTLRAPLLVYRHGSRFNLAIGTQRGSEIQTLLGPVPFDGLRLDTDLDVARLSLSAGTTTALENYPSYLGRRGPSSFYRQAVSLGLPLGEEGAVELSASLWQPKEARFDRDHALLGLTVDPQLQGAVRGWGAFGLDLRAPVGTGTSDRSALSWNLNADLPRFRFRGRQEAYGRAFGPNLPFGSRRGLDLMVLDASLDLAPNLTLREGFNRSVVQSPVGLPLRVVASDTWQTELTWRATPHLAFRARRQDGLGNTLRGPDSTYSTTWFQGQWRAAPDWALRGETSWFAASSGSSLATTRLNVRHDLDPRSALSLDYARLDSRGTRDRLTNSWTLLYTLRAPEDDASLSVGWNYRTFSPAVVDQASVGSLTFRGEWEPAARWRLGGSYDTAVDASGDPLHRYAAFVSYLVDESNEVRIAYKRDPFLDDFLPPDVAYNAGHVFMLELRQSLGGPLNQEFRRRLAPRVDVQVRVRPGGVPGAEALPRAGIPVRWDARRTRLTDADGKARLASVKPGPTEVSLDMRALGPNYEPEGPSSRTLDLGEGDREQVAFDLTAWSSIYAVVWNDVDGDGKPDAGYVPFTKQPIRVSGQADLSTDEQGVANFTRLPPGRYEVQLVGELPPALVATTPVTRTVEIAPGEEKVVEIGLQGRGRLRGAVRLVPEGAREPGPLPAPLALQVNGKPLGATAGDGTFDLDAPAGDLTVTPIIAPLGTRVYPVASVTDHAVRLEAGGEASLDVVLARYAQVTVQLTRGGAPLALSGVAFGIEGDGFAYTDEQGQAVFEELPMGPHRFTLDAATLPPDLAPVSGRFELDLASGEKRTVQVEMKAPGTARRARASR